MPTPTPAATPSAIAPTPEPTPLPAAAKPLPVAPTTQAPAAGTVSAPRADAPPAGPAAAATQAPAGTRPTEPGPAVPGSGAPDAGARLGHDVPTPPSLPASAPRLNLELARPRGGEISSFGAKGVLQLMPRPPETKSKLGADIQNAAKPDCRTAYSAMGVAAVAPLAVDAVRDKGCRW